MKSVSFQGEISSLALADVVQNLATNKKSGTLTIQREEQTRHIQFRDGKILSYTDNLGFSIVDWLLDKEVIEDGQREEALRRYRKAKRKSFGEILRDLKILDLEEYRSYLQDLVLETLYEVLSFREGSFEFEEGNLDDELGDRETRSLDLEFAAQNVIMEAARRMDDWQNIRQRVPSENEIYHIPTAERERVVGEAEDDVTRSVAQFMDGTRTVRQVVARAPYTRFDACRAIANLVAEKKAKLLDSSGLMHPGRVESDPKQEIACLKTILEREPNNRQILRRLADLHEQEGDRGESVTFNKLLAISFLEDGDIQQAEENLRKALRLNPRDIATWRKLWEVVLRTENREKIAGFGSQFAAHFKKLGLVEVARDHLEEMTRLFPDQPKFKVDLADVRFALGERKACVQGLFEVARDLLGQRRFDDAEKVFARILKYDRNNQKAREYHDKIRSGVLAQRRAFRRRLVRRVALAVGFTLVAGFFAYDLYVRTLLSTATQGVLADSLIEKSNYDEALERIRKIRDEHPYSLTANLEARALMLSLQSKRESVRANFGGKKG